MKGYIRKRGAAYSYTVDIGRDPVTGKRKQKTKSGFKTKKAAQEALNALLYEVNKGVYIVDNKATFEELAREWLENSRSKWRESTFVTNKTIVEKWLIGHLGKLKIQEIKPIHGSKFSKKLAENLVPSTARGIFSKAKQVLSYAVDMELIAKNPFEKIPLPLERRAEKTTWTFEQINTFLRVAMLDNMFCHNYTAVAAFSGMRKGEIFGLRIQDVDFEKNIIRIRQSLGETNEHGLYFTDLKTVGSNRDIWMDDNLRKVLKDQIRRVKEYKLALGKDYNEHNLVFCNAEGHPYRPSSANKAFNRITRKAGVPQIRFHDLRHTHATLLLEIGVNPKVIAERLGHSDIKTTLNTYSHVTPIQQENAMSSFSERFKAANN